MAKTKENIKKNKKKVSETTKKRPRSFVKKPSRYWYDENTEYVAKNKKGEWVIKKYQYGKREETPYQSFQKEFSKYLRQNDIDAKEYGGYNKLASEFWSKEKLKYGFEDGKSKKAIRKNKKAKQGFEQAKSFGQLENDIYDIFQNRKGGGVVIEKLLTEVENEVAVGWWHNDLVYDKIDYYDLGKKVIAVMYDEFGNYAGLKLVESEEDRNEIKQNHKEIGEQTHSINPSTYYTSSLAYDEKSGCLIHYLTDKEENLKDHLKEKGIDLNKELKKIGIYREKMTKEERIKEDIKEISREIAIANNNEDFDKTAELTKKLLKKNEQLKKLKIKK